MGFILFLLLAAIVFVVLDLKHAKYMRNRYALILAILSVAWWAYLIIEQLNVKLDCTPNDAFCNEGNTLQGKIIWGTSIAAVTLFYVWITYIIVAYIIDKRKNSKKSKPK